MLRERLPHRRENLTRTVRVGNRTVHFNVGLYPDGRPGEVFVDVAKTGTAVRAWAGATAKLISLMLQYSIPLREITEALDGTNSVPWGAVPVTGHPGVEACAGEIDYVAKALAADFPDFYLEADKDAWDMLADSLDRLFGDGECDADEVRDQLGVRGVEDALDTLLEELCE